MPDPVVDFRNPGVFGPAVNPGGGVNWPDFSGSGFGDADWVDSIDFGADEVSDVLGFLGSDAGRERQSFVDHLIEDWKKENRPEQKKSLWDKIVGTVEQWAGPAATFAGTAASAKMLSDTERRAQDILQRNYLAEWDLADQTRAERTEPMEAYNAMVQDKINRANSRNLAFQTMAGNFMAEHAFPGQDMQFDKYLPPDLPASMQSTAARDRMPYPGQSSSQARQSTPEYSTRYRGLSYEDLGAEQAWQNSQERERKAREHEYGDSFWDPIKSAIGPAATLAGSVIGGPPGVAVAMGGNLISRL
jgi:hypothetical protein